MRTSEMIGIRGIHYSQNVRYCNDRTVCVEGSMIFKFVAGSTFDLTKPNIDQ